MSGATAAIVSYNGTAICQGPLLSSADENQRGMVLGRIDTDLIGLSLNGSQYERYPSSRVSGDQ
jgi:hypothetical protein